MSLFGKKDRDARNYAAEEEERRHEAWTRPDQGTTPLRAERRTTDRGCLYTFLGFVVYIVVVLVYASTHGSIVDYFGFRDYAKNVCGLSPTTADKPYLYMCQDQKGGLNQKGPVCVARCPKSSGTQTQCPSSGKGVHFVHDYPTEPYAGKLCMPTTHPYKDAVKRVIHGHSGIRFFLIVSNALEHYWAPVLAVAVTMALGFSHVVLLKHAGLCFVWIGFGLMIGVPLFLGAWLIRSTYSGDLDTIIAGDGTGGLTAGVVSIALAISLSCLLLCDWRDMRVAKITMQAAAECILDTAGLIVWPFLALAVRVSLFLGLSLGFLLLVSCKVPGFALEALYIFAALWVLQVCTAASQFVVAYVAEEWFFATLSMNSKQVEGGVTCRALCDGLRYHLGTLAFGALVLPLVWIPRSILSYVNRLGEMDNPVGACVRSVFGCCIEFYQRRMECLTRSIWMDVALNSLPFRPASANAMSVIADEATDVSSMHGAAWLIELGGAGGITAICVLIAHFMCTHCWPFNDPETARYVGNPVLVDIIVALLSWPIAVDFLLVVVHVSDCLLFCCAVDRSRNPLRAIVEEGSEGLFSSCASQPRGGTRYYNDDRGSNHLPSTRALLTMVTREREEDSGYCG